MVWLFHETKIKGFGWFLSLSLYGAPEIAQEIKLNLLNSHSFYDYSNCPTIDCFLPLSL